jgi:hypothetical protein
MKYTTPELLVIGPALELIQSTGQGTKGNPPSDSMCTGVNLLCFQSEEDE